MWRPAFNKQMLWSTADPRGSGCRLAPAILECLSVSRRHWRSNVVLVLVCAAPSWHIDLASVPQAGEEAEFSGRVICSCQFSSYGPRPSILLNTPVSTMQDLFPTFICSGGNFAVPCTADGLAYYASAFGAFRTSWTPQAGVGNQPGWSMGMFVLPMFVLRMCVLRWSQWIVP